MSKENELLDKMSLLLKEHAGEEKSRESDGAGERVAELTFAFVSQIIKESEDGKLPRGKNFWRKVGRTLEIIGNAIKEIVDTWSNP